MRSRRDIAAAWAARPWSYSRATWALVLALGALPWPWGEEILARGFVARAFVRRARLRRARDWAAAQRGDVRRLAWSLCFHHGRFVARSALMGMRDPETFRRHTALRGEEHLAAAGPGVILLGAHLGPPQSYLALRVLGNRLTWVGSRGASPAWPESVRDRYQRAHGDLLFPGTARAWERRLYRAREILLEGRSVFISADGGGSQAFSVPLPGGAASIGAGWLVLRRTTKAPVLPVLSHMEGRLQVVTIHPPLPATVADPALDLDVCRDALATLFGEYVRQFPEQCYSLVFGLPPDEPPAPTSSSSPVKIGETRRGALAPAVSPPDAGQFPPTLGSVAAAPSGVRASGDRESRRLARRAGGSKRILIVAMESVFPKVKASQDRVYRMAERLSRDHVVDVATTVREGIELEESRARLGPVCRAFHPIAPINPFDSPLRRALRAAEYHLLHRPRLHPHHYVYGGHPRVTAQLAELVRRHRYDVVQVEYWYMARLFPGIDGSIFKAIDTNDVLSDRQRQEMVRRYGPRLPARRRRELAKYRELEIRHLRLADLLIAISPADRAAYADLDLGNDTVLIPIGQDLEHFKNGASPRRKDDVVLFYGNMGARSNIDAFHRLWRDIFPRIKRAVPNARLLAVGANPPESIRRLHDGRGVVVTGYVDDVRGWLAQAKVAVIPLEVATGFRGRVVELMAMEIPLVGTHRALDCVQLEEGVHGFATDSDAEIAEHAARLLIDDGTRQAMGSQCRALAAARYSIEATIGALSRRYLEV